jgi:hypothetical protein
LERAAFCAGAGAQPRHPRIHPRSGEGGAGIPGRQAHRGAGRGAGIRQRCSRAAG